MPELLPWETSVPCSRIRGGVRGRMKNTYCQTLSDGDQTPVMWSIVTMVTGMTAAAVPFIFNRKRDPAQEEQLAFCLFYTQ